MNLSGIIFHIEEDAFDKLSKYLATIKGYFSDSDGRDEIMSDIESRIAEMLQEKVSTVKQGVLMADVEQVISIMGRPEDFAGDSATSEKKEEKKEEPQPDINVKKRVFRDPDDKVLGGVCSGIGAYFDFDPIWLRLGFAITFFFFGGGFLLYIILWMVIPKAKTTTEKLQMKGETVNISNIKKNFEEELESLKGKAKEAGEQASKIGSKENKQKVKDGVDRFVEFCTDVFGGAFKAMAKIFAVIFIVLGIFVLIFLLSSLFGGTDVIHFSNDGVHSSYSIREFFTVLFMDNQQMNMAVIGCVLFFGVPFLMLMYKGVKMLFGIKESNRIVRYSASALWLAGLVTLIFVIYDLAQEFDEEATQKEVVHVIQPRGNTLYLQVQGGEKYVYDDDEKSYHRRSIHIGRWTSNGSDADFSMGFPKLDIIPSDSDTFELMVLKSSHGTTKKEAIGRARNIDYSLVQHDSVLEFNPKFDLPKAELWRAQGVQLVLKVPRNKTVYLNRSARHIIYDIDNVTDTYDGDMVGRRWMMTSEGLACVDCEGLSKRRKKDYMNNIGEEVMEDLRKEGIIPPKDSSKGEKY